MACAKDLDHPYVPPWGSELKSRPSETRRTMTTRVLAFAACVFGLVAMVFLPMLAVQNSRLRHERDKWRERAYELLIEHEGYHYVKGLPLPVPPEPRYP